jgi:hypothetical protein
MLGPSSSGVQALTNVRQPDPEGFVAWSISAAAKMSGSWLGGMNSHPPGGFHGPEV